MNDHERLIRLLTLAADKITEWYHPIADRKLADLDRQTQTGNSGINPMEDKTPIETAGRKLSTMTRYIQGADLWHRSAGTQGQRQDAHELPGFVLEAVTGLPDDMVVLLGTWVQQALGLPEADPRELGQMWSEDVKATAWRLLLEHGAWPGQHTENREPLEIG